MPLNGHYNVVDKHQGAELEGDGTLEHSGNNKPITAAVILDSCIQYKYIPVG